MAPLEEPWVNEVMACAVFMSCIMQNVVRLLCSGRPCCPALGGLLTFQNSKHFFSSYAGKSKKWHALPQATNPNFPDGDPAPWPYGETCWLDSVFYCTLIGNKAQIHLRTNTRVIFMRWSSFQWICRLKNSDFHNFYVEHISAHTIFKCNSTDASRDLVFISPF